MNLLRTPDELAEVVVRWMRGPGAAPASSGDAAGERRCVRCGASPDGAPLIATPEGWMCERCYADVK